jgi:hypothetical protein
MLSARLESHIPFALTEPPEAGLYADSKDKGRLDSSLEGLSCLDSLDSRSRL